MKRVLVHWVEVRTYEVPDECPTDDTEEFYQWIDENTESNVDDYAISKDSRDLEIVDVEQL